MGMYGDKKWQNLFVAEYANKVDNKLNTKKAV